MSERKSKSTGTVRPRTRRGTGSRASSRNRFTYCAVTRRAVLATLIFLTCAFSGITTSIPLLASEQEAAEPQDTLTRDVEALWTRVAKLREVSTLDRPSAIRATEETRFGIAAVRAATWLDSNRLAARGEAWADIGFGTKQTPERMLLAVAMDLGPAAWEPGGERLLVDPDTLTESDFVAEGEDSPTISLLLATGVRPDEPVLAHLMVHRLQGEDEEGATTTDAFLARHAAREGEATLVATMLLFEPLGLELEELEIDPIGMLEGRLSPIGGKSPLERSILDFVHTDGYLWAKKNYLRSGWKEWTEPDHTAEILGIEVKPSQQLAEDTSPKGWEVLDSDQLGMFGMYLWIANVTGKDSLALLTREGWREDRLLRLRHATLGEVTQLSSNWKDEAAARQFRYALERVFQARFPSATIDWGKEGSARSKLGGNTVIIRTIGSEVELLIGSESAVNDFFPEQHQKTQGTDPSSSP